MLLLAFLCSIFIGLRTYYYVNQFSESSESILNKTVYIQSDSITVDGSSLKMIGKVDGKKYVLYYSLKSPEEKQRWTANQPQIGRAHV